MKMNNTWDSNPMDKLGQEGSQDRRDFSRIPVGGIAMLRPAAHPERVILGKVVDVSASGLSILLKQPLNTQLDLELLVSVDEPENHFLIHGSVMWCRENRAANGNGDGYTHRAGIVLTMEDDLEDATDWRALFLA